MKSHGFTLIELLVVIVLIGIITSMTLISVNRAGQEPLEYEKQRLSKAINYASQESIIRNELLGLILETEGYFFVSLLSDGEWSEYKSSNAMKAYETENETRFYLDTKSDDNTPALFFYPSGEVSPAIIELIDQTSDQRLYLEVDGLGRVTQSRERPQT